MVGYTNNEKLLIHCFQDKLFKLMPGGRIVGPPPYKVMVGFGEGLLGLV